MSSDFSIYERVYLACFFASGQNQRLLIVQNLDAINDTLVYGIEVCWIAIFLIKKPIYLGIRPSTLSTTGVRRITIQVVFNDAI